MKKVWTLKSVPTLRHKVSQTYLFDWYIAWNIHFLGGRFNLAKQFGVRHMQHLFVCVQTRNREQLENKVVLGLKIILSLLLRLENVSKSGMWIEKSYGHEQGSYFKEEKCITVLSLKEKKLLSQVKTIQGSLCKSKLSHTGKSGLTYLWLSKNIEYTGHRRWLRSCKDLQMC